MRVLLSTGSLKVTVFLLFKMDLNTLENGLKVRCTEKEKKNGLMELPLKVII